MNETSNPVLKEPGDFLPVVCLMLYMVFPDFCKSRDLSPEDIQRACEACIQWKEEHPEMTREETIAWLQKYMDEKFPKQS